MADQSRWSGSSEDALGQYDASYPAKEVDPNDPFARMQAHLDATAPQAAPDMAPRDLGEIDEPRYLGEIDGPDSIIDQSPPPTIVPADKRYYDEGEKPSVVPPGADPLLSGMQAYAGGVGGAQGGGAGAAPGTAGASGAKAGKDWMAEARAKEGWQPESLAHGMRRSQEGDLVKAKFANEAEGHHVEEQGHLDQAAQMASDNAEAAKRFKAEQDANDQAEATIARERAHTDAIRTNPNRYKENLGFGGTALAALTMIIGGAGAGISGQKNLAAEAFDDAIKKDIDVQKEDYDRGVHKVKGLEDDYSRRRDRLKDERATRHMMLADKYRGAAELVKAKMAGVAAEGSAVDADGSVNLLEMKALEHEEKAAQAVRQQAYALRAADAARKAAAAAEEAKHRRSMREQIFMKDLDFQHAQALQQTKNAGKGAGAGKVDQSLDKYGKVLEKHKIPERSDQLQRMRGILFEGGDLTKPKSDVAGTGKAGQIARELIPGARYLQSQESANNDQEFRDYATEEIKHGGAALTKMEKELYTNVAEGRGTLADRQYIIRKASQRLEAEKLHADRTYPGAAQRYEAGGGDFGFIPEGETSSPYDRTDDDKKDDD